MKEIGKRNKNFYNCPFICTAKHNSYDNIEQILMKCVRGLHISFVPWWTTQGSTVYEHFNFRFISKYVEKTDKCSAEVVEKWW